MTGETIERTLNNFKQGHGMKEEGEKRERRPILLQFGQVMMSALSVSDIEKTARVHRQLTTWL